MKLDAKLIEKKQEQPPVKRAFWGSVTALCWLLYLYLWLPAITFVMWLLGINNAYVQLYLSEGRLDPYLLISLPLFMLTCTVFLVAWSYYNRFRFGGHERRTAPEPVSPDVIAQTLGADRATAARLRACKWVTLNMDDEAKPVGVVDHTQTQPKATLKEASPEAATAVEADLSVPA